MNEQIMQPGRVVSRWIAAGIMVLSIGSCEEVPTAESETVETTQLLYNGGAEGGEARPDAWLTNNPPGGQYVFEWADGIAASGARSIGIRRTEAAMNSSFGAWLQRAPSIPRTDVTYVLSASVKLDQVTGGGAIIAIRGDASAITGGPALAIATTEGRQLLAGTRDWTRISVQLSGVPENVDLLTVFLMLQSNSSGTVYFDDVTLSVVRKTNLNQ